MRDIVKKIGADIYTARWAIILIIAYFAFLHYFLYSLCPVRVITGFPCPGCGLTHAGFCLLRLDFAGAWSVHPFIYPIGILAILFVVNRYFLKGQPLTNLLYVLAILTLAGMIIFYIWRMLTQFPGDPPMDYYTGNLISRIVNLIRVASASLP